MSFLLQTGTNNGYRAFEMHNGGNADAANRTLQIGCSSVWRFSACANPTFGFRVNNNGALDFNPRRRERERPSVSGEVQAVDDRTTPTRSPSGTIPAWRAWPAIRRAASRRSGFNFAADRLGIGHFSGTAVGFDELRIGTTLPDVFTNFLTCDVNGNGVCNSSDIDIISQHMYLPGDFAQGDIDGSGIVDFADYRLFKDHPARVVGFDPPGSGGASSGAGTSPC